MIMAAETTGALVRWFEDIGIEDVPLVGEKRLVGGNVPGVGGEGGEGAERIRGHGVGLSGLPQRGRARGDSQRDAQGSGHAGSGRSQSPVLRQKCGTLSHAAGI
jgi:hypothetical protein